jgi:hypothetical protein
MRLGGPQSRSGRGVEDNSAPPLGIEPRSSDRPARSQSLYQLSYHGSLFNTQFSRQTLTDIIQNCIHRLLAHIPPPPPHQIVYFIIQPAGSQKQWETKSEQLDDWGFKSRRGLGIFLFTTMSRPALRSTQPSIQWVPGALSLGVKWPRRESDH